MNRMAHKERVNARTYFKPESKEGIQAERRGEKRKKKERKEGTRGKGK